MRRESAGVPIIDVVFEIDSNGILNVEASDKAPTQPHNCHAWQRQRGLALGTLERRGVCMRPRSARSAAPTVGGRACRSGLRRAFAPAAVARGRIDSVCAVSSVSRPFGWGRGPHSRRASPSAKRTPAGSPRSRSRRCSKTPIVTRRRHSLPRSICRAYRYRQRVSPLTISVYFEYRDSWRRYLFESRVSSGAIWPCGRWRVVHALRPTCEP
jgi:hypothetical protein